MIGIAFISLMLFIQDAPFKAREDFEIKFDLSFKQRQQATDDGKTLHLNETRSEYEKRTSLTPLPYLQIFIKIINTNPKEVKLKIVQDLQSVVLRKKVERGMEFKLTPGFTDDIKDGVSGFKHVIEFYSEEKDILSVIVIEFDKEGSYFVNGELRGKI